MGNFIGCKTNVRFVGFKPLGPNLFTSSIHGLVQVGSLGLSGFGSGFRATTHPGAEPRRGWANTNTFLLDIYIKKYIIKILTIYIY
jgi:hypothetical protein